MSYKLKKIVIFISTLIGLIALLGIIIFFGVQFSQNKTVRGAIVFGLIIWVLLVVNGFFLVLLPIIRSWSNQTNFGPSEYYQKQIKKIELEKKLEKIFSVFFLIVSVVLVIYSLIYMSSLSLYGFWTYARYAFKCIGIAIVVLITEDSSFSLPEVFVGLGVLSLLLWTFIGIATLIRFVKKIGLKYMK